MLSVSLGEHTVRILLPLVRLTNSAPPASANRHGDRDVPREDGLEENIAELLEELFMECPEDEPLRPRDARARLKKAMEERQEWAEGLLLRDPPEIHKPSREAREAF